MHTYVVHIRLREVIPARPCGRALRHELGVNVLDRVIGDAANGFTLVSE